MTGTKTVPQANTETNEVTVREASLTQIDWLAAQEISVRAAKGRSNTPLTAADVFGKYGLADPPR